MPLRAVAAALRLRAWALRTLGGAPAAPPRAPAAAWRLFLAVERCALPLHARLGAGAAGVRLPDDARALLRSAATEELQRVMAARRQLQMLGALAARRGWRAVVLKGGVAAAESAAAESAADSGAAVDLADLDVLAPPAEGAALAAALDALGYAAVGGGEARHHLDERDEPDSLPVEVHTTLHHGGAPTGAGVWARAVPLGGAPGLERPGGADHLWHVLTHSALDHPHRRGGLRDLLLAAAAWRSCSAAERDEVRARAAAHPEHAAMLGALLRTAESLAAGPAAAAAAPAAPDPFARVAAASYLFAVLSTRRGIGALLPGVTEIALFSLVGDGADRRRFWRSAAAPAPPPVHRPMTRLERAAPRLGAAVRLAARWRRLGIAAGMAAVSVVLGRLAR